MHIFGWVRGVGQGLRSLDIDIEIVYCIILKWISKKYE
jgi:hypothetical protein